MTLGRLMRLLKVSPETPQPIAAPDLASTDMACPQGLTWCNGKCVDMTSDNANCGKCANACPMGNVCSMSACALSCQNGLTSCNGKCANLTSDNANCLDSRD